MIFPRFDARPPRADHSHKETPRGKHSRTSHGARMPLPRGITLPSGSRPVYGLTRFDAPPSRAVKPSGISTWRARARLPLRGQHKNWGFRIELSVLTIEQRLCGLNILNPRSSILNPKTYRTCFPIIPDRRSQPGHLEPRRREFLRLAATRDFNRPRVVIRVQPAFTRELSVLRGNIGNSPTNQGYGSLKMRARRGKPHSKMSVRC